MIRSDQLARPTHPFEVTHRDVWRIAVPATFAFVTEPLAGIVDLTVIGRLGDAGLLGGLVLGVLAFDFLFAFMFFLRLGTAGLVAQAQGAKAEDAGLLHFLRASALGLVLGTLLWILTPLIIAISLTILAPESEVVAPFTTYVGVRMWSTPFVLVNFALLGWFYGRAEATIGLMLQLIIHGGNIGFSILFVYGLGWGVSGVATGTVLAQAISAGVGLYIVVRQAGGLREMRAKTKLSDVFELTAIRRLFSLSRDLMIRSAALSAVFVFFTAQTSRAGTTELAANAIVLNFLMITAFFQDGQAQAAEQLCGKAVGANWRPAFERAVKLSLIWGYLISTILFFMWLTIGPGLIDLMTTSDDVRALARNYVFVGALTALTGVLPFVIDGVMIGATLNHLVRNGMVAALILFLLAAWILQPAFGLMGLWAALHIFFIARGLIFSMAVWRKLPRLFPSVST